MSKDKKRELEEMKLTHVGTGRCLPATIHSLPTSKNTLARAASTIQKRRESAASLEEAFESEEFESSEGSELELDSDGSPRKSPRRARSITKSPKLR